MSMRPRILVLAYHSINIAGNDHVNNDHVALAEDLQLLTELGYHILPLDRIVEGIGSNALDLLPRRTAAITFDDGQDFDFFDLAHPEWGVQRSFFNIVSDFRRSANGRKQPDLHATSFVIVSPNARSELDQTCMLGCGWWNDHWWQAAIGTGLLGIGNHSWDHNHEALPESFSQGIARGRFSNIESKVLADHEIRQAAEFLRARAPNPGTAHFAYPYGESNGYLADEYFPCYGAELGIEAAFTTRPGYLEPGCGRWEIPRFLCGRDWTSPAELQSILDAASEAQGWWIPPALAPRTREIGRAHV